MIATDCFTRKEVDFLCEIINILGNFEARQQGTRNVIYIPVKNTPKFLDFISPCPVQCFEYKWKLQ